MIPGNGSYFEYQRRPDMSWDYRVVKHEDEYALQEVFYNDDGTIFGWSGIDISGYTLDDLRETVKSISSIIENSSVLHSRDDTLYDSDGNQVSGGADV